MTTIKQTILLLSLFLTASCELEEDAECLPNTIEIHSLEDIYGCSDTRYGVEIDLSNDFTIIRSQNQYDNLVTGNCTPQINFSHYDLIIGKKGLSSGNNHINYNYYFDCQYNRLILEVVFVQNMATVAPNITYHALVPKLGHEDMVDLTISVEY